MHREELAGCKKVLGKGYLHKLTSIDIQAQILGRQVKYAEAHALNRETLERMERVLL